MLFIGRQDRIGFTVEQTVQLNKMFLDFEWQLLKWKEEQSKSKIKIYTEDDLKAINAEHWKKFL